MNIKINKLIKEIEKSRNCYLCPETAEKLVEKIAKKYHSSNNKKEFKNLVERETEKLELNYNYCRVAFSYFSSNKKNGNKGEKFIRNQMFFSFYKPVVRY